MHFKKTVALLCLISVSASHLTYAAETLAVSTDAWEKIHAIPEKNRKIFTKNGLNFVLVANEDPAIENNVVLPANEVTGKKAIIGIVAAATVVAAVTAWNSVFRNQEFNMNLKRFDQSVAFEEEAYKATLASLNSNLKAENLQYEKDNTFNKNRIDLLEKALKNAELPKQQPELRKQGFNPTATLFHKNYGILKNSNSQKPVYHYAGLPTLVGGTNPELINQRLEDARTNLTNRENEFTAKIAQAQDVYSEKKDNFDLKISELTVLRRFEKLGNPFKPAYQWNILQKIGASAAGLLGGSTFAHGIYKDWVKANVKVTQLLKDATKDLTFFTMSPSDFEQVVKEFSRRGFTTPDQLELSVE